MPSSVVTLRNPNSRRPPSQTKGSMAVILPPTLPNRACVGLTWPRIVDNSIGTPGLEGPGSDPPTPGGGVPGWLPPPSSEHARCHSDHVATTGKDGRQDERRVRSDRLGVHGPHLRPVPGEARPRRAPGRG